MKLNEYQDKALTNLTIPANRSFINYGVIGLSEEVGELAGHMKKFIRDGTWDEKRVIKELGDVQWYVNYIAKCLGVTAEEIAKINLEKLEARAKKGTLQGSGDDR